MESKLGVGIHLSGVRRAFPGNVVVLDDVRLSIGAGDFVAILGPSGCGKSTLLRLIAGLDRPDGGAIELSGDERGSKATAPRAPIAFVFQDAHLLPWRTVIENAALPLELMGVSREERLAAALEMLKKVGLEHAQLRYPAQLSGGMRMRVSLARALVTRPRLLLLDEPFAALDELSRARLDDELRALWSEMGMTILFVTHSTYEAAYLAERTVVLGRHPARVVADRSLSLPRERTSDLRTEPDFLREVRALQQALEASEA